MTDMVPVFTAVNAGTLPVPVLVPPIVLSLLDQLNVVPDTVPVNVTGVVWAPLHTAWLVGAAVTVGVGLMVIVKVTGVPVQLFALGVTV